MTIGGREYLGKFNVREPIASSTLATLYKGHDPSEGRQVALKVLRPYFSEVRGVLDAYFTEVRRIAALHHPHILEVFDSGDDTSPWVAMEFIATGSLKERIGHPVSLQEADKLLSQIAGALEAAHRIGILHRDLKPANVFITPTGDYKLADFGMATLAGGAHPILQTSSATPMPAYMSPEQALGHSLTERSDVYSLGVLLYHLLTGRVPYPATDPTTVWAKQMGPPPPRPEQLNSRVPLPVSAVIQTALSTNPEKRYASPGQMAAAFHQGVEQAGREAPEVQATPSPQPARPPAVEAPPREVSRAGGLSSYVHCEACGQATLSTALQCPNCGALLAPAGVREDAAVAVRRLNARKGVAVGALALAIFIGVVAFLVSGGGRLPAPASTLTSASGPGEWSMHQRDPAHSGFLPGQAPIPRGQVKWRFVTSEPVLAAPAVAGETVYLATGDRRVVALAADSGAVLWEHPVSGPVDATPAVAGGSLFVGLRDGQLLALDRQTGQLRWAFTGSGPIYSSPVVKDGVVYFGSGGGTLHAVDAQTGRSYWDFQAGTWISSAPAVSDEGILVFGSRDGNVYFIDTSNKKSRLRYRVALPVEASPAISGDTAYIGSNSGGFLALDLTERRRPFDSQFLRARLQLFIWNMISNPPEQRGFVWGNRVSRRDPITSTPAVTDAFVYITSHDGKLYALDRESGRTLWSFATGKAIGTSPIVAGDTVYFSSPNGKLYGLDADTGANVWEWTAGSGSAPSTSPVMANGVLYVAASQEKPEVELFQAVGSADWYYRYGSTPCSAGSEPSGPFLTKERALVAAQRSPPACGVLYAIE